MLRTPLKFPAAIGATARGGQTAALLLSVLLAFACAALAVGWGLRLIGSPRPVPSDAQLIGALSPDQAAQQAARLFGAEPIKAASAAAPSRFRLYGVIAGGDTGSALIGVDGKPPRAVGVGEIVSPGVVLHSTAYKAVWLERDGVRQELKLEPQAAGAVGAVAQPPYLPPRPSFAPPAVAPALAPPTINPPVIAPRIDNESG